MSTITIPLPEEDLGLGVLGVEDSLVEGANTCLRQRTVGTEVSSEVLRRKGLSARAHPGAYP